MAERKRATKSRRKEKKNVPSGHVHIQASFNNTIVTITDLSGAVVAWGSAGTAGFKGSRKSTPYAAALAADGAAKRAMEHVMQLWETEVGRVRILKVMRFMKPQNVNAILAEIELPKLRDILLERLKVVTEAKK